MNGSRGRGNGIGSEQGIGIEIQSVVTQVRVVQVENVIYPFFLFFYITNFLWNRINNFWKKKVRSSNNFMIE